MSIILIVLIFVCSGCSELGLGSNCSEWKLVSETTSTDRNDVNLKKYERCIDGGYQIRYDWYRRGNKYDTEIYTYYD